MNKNIEVAEHDCYGNPFLLSFKDAVTFKIKHALTSNTDIQGLFEKILYGEHREFLEEAEIEIFLYPTKKTLAKAEEIFQVLTEIIAIMAFIPGGITMFGYHYEIENQNISIEQVFL